MISQYIGPIGSGKSYHALEDLMKHMDKGGYVIANFPLNFTERMIRRGYSDRFLYLPDELLTDERGVSLLLSLSRDYEFNEFTKKCLVVLDEVGDIFPPNQDNNPIQRTWKLFFKQSRKLGYDFIMIMQDETEINRTIRKCMEYMIVHRKANSIFPFKYLPFTMFMHITYWKQSRTRLTAGSTIFVKKFAKLYNTHQLFGNLKNHDKMPDLKSFDFPIHFGNLKVAGGPGGSPKGGTRFAGHFQMNRRKLEMKQRINLYLAEREQDELRAFADRYEIEYSKLLLLAWRLVDKSKLADLLNLEKGLPNSKQ